MCTARPFYYTQRIASACILLPAAACMPPGITSAAITALCGTGWEQAQEDRIDFLKRNNEMVVDMESVTRGLPGTGLTYRRHVHAPTANRGFHSHL